MSASRRVVSANGTEWNPAKYSESGLNLEEGFLVYFEKGDPEIMLNDRIIFDLNGEKTIYVKALRPYTMVIQNKVLEAFCLQN